MPWSELTSRLHECIGCLQYDSNRISKMRYDDRSRISDGFVARNRLCVHSWDYKGLRSRNTITRAINNDQGVIRVRRWNRDALFRSGHEKHVDDDICNARHVVANLRVAGGSPRFTTLLILSKVSGNARNCTKYQLFRAKSLFPNCNKFLTEGFFLRPYETVASFEGRFIPSECLWINSPARASVNYRDQRIDSRRYLVKSWCVAHKYTFHLTGFTVRVNKSIILSRFPLRVTYQFLSNGVIDYTPVENLVADAARNNSIATKSAIAWNAKLKPVGNYHKLLSILAQFSLPPINFASNTLASRSA